MPIHDWSHVRPGLFHHFHQAWVISLTNALNSGKLPSGFFALAEQRTGSPIPDVVALQSDTADTELATEESGGMSVALAPPQTRFLLETSDLDAYAEKADHIVIHTDEGEVVALIEIVSPGNKHSRHAIDSFVRKVTDFLSAGVHLLIIDLLPPGPRDPQGIPALVWSEFEDHELRLPPDKPLTLASYVGGGVKRAYIEPVAVGDVLPSMPIFLRPDMYVPVPLEDTYQTTWNVCPQQLKNSVLGRRQE